MRRYPLISLLALVLIAISSHTCLSQATGLYQFGPFDSHGFDTVNRGDLNVHFSVPIISKPGRGGANFTYSLSYDSLVWVPIASGASQIWSPVQGWGWTDSTQAEFGYVSYSNSLAACTLPPHGQNSIEYSYTNYVYHDNHGHAHTIPYDYIGACGGGPPPPGTATYSLTDNSGLTIYRDNNNFVIFTAGGAATSVSTVIAQINGQPVSQTPLPGTYTDTNGNEITASSSGVFTDTMGMTPLSVSGAAPSPVTYTYKDTTGTARSVTVHYSSYTVLTNFGISGITEFSASNVSLVSSIVLPDNSEYQFTYEPTPGHSGEVTGRLAQITLPTGGTISYSFPTDPMLSDGTPGSLTRTTSDGTTQYTRTGTSGPYTTEIIDGSGNISNYTFLKDTYGHFFESDRKVYNTAITTPPQYEIFTCYNDDTSGCVNPSVNGGIGYISTTTMYGPGGLINAALTGAYFNDIQEFTGPELLYLDTGTNLQYQYQQFTGQYGLPFWRLQTVSNAGSGATILTDDYDEGTVTATSGLPQHVAVTGSRGNLTSQHITLAGKSYTLNQANTYDDAGQSLTSTDWNSNKTTYKYDAGTDTLPTETDLPKIGTYSPKMFTTYDSNTGLLVGMTDLNSKITCHQYDSLLRPTATIYPDGGQVTETYTGQTTIGQQLVQSGGSGNSSTCQTSTTGQMLSVTASLDSYGRPSSIQQADPAGAESVGYSYDVNGRLYSATNPHRSGSSPTDGTTYYSYDGAGRVTQVLEADGSKRLYNYYTQLNTLWGWILLTDETGRQKYMQPDMYGRVASVYELDSNNNPTISTSYGYDYMNHITSIAQPSRSTRAFSYDAAGRLTISTTPEEGTITYSYDTGGTTLCSGSLSSPCSRTDNASRQTKYTYDALDRLTGKTYPGSSTPSVTYSYDQTGTVMGIAMANGLGRLTSMTDGSGGSAFSYDPTGRPSGLARKINGVTKSASYTYNLDGTVAKLFYFDGQELDYSYNGVSQPVSAVEPSGNSYASAAQYAPTGQLLQMVRGYTSSFAGISTLNSFNSRMQPTLLSATPPSPASAVLSLNYSYGTAQQNNGNISQIINNRNVSRNQTFGYDQLNRVQSAQETTLAGNTYVYDNWGNLLQMNQIPGTNIGQNLVVTANANNQLSDLTYDLAGETTKDNVGNQYVYDTEGRITSVAGVNYTFDGNGVRMMKSGGSYSREYWTGAYGETLNESDLTGSITERNVYFRHEIIARRDNSSGNVHFIYHDHLGSARVVTSATGVIQDDLDYYPYGTTVAFSQSSGNIYNFTGYEHDSESGTEHAWFRNLSGTLGRYMRPDPYNASYNPIDPQSLNRYAYVENRPLQLTDPVGLFKKVGGNGGYTDCGNDPICPQADDDWGSGASDYGEDLGENGSYFVYTSDGYMDQYGDVWNFGTFDSDPAFLGGANGEDVQFLGETELNFMPIDGGFTVFAQSSSGSNGAPPPHKPPDPILKYASCSAAVQSEANRGRLLASIANGVALGNGVVGCFFTGPGVLICEAGVGTVDLLVASATEYAYQSAIYDGETQCMNGH